MAVNRREFLSVTGLSASAILGMGSLTACSGERALSDADISQILGDYLYVGAEHQDLMQAFINDLRLSTSTILSAEEIASILRGELGREEAERFVIQEFVRYSNYRMWLRRQDQTLGVASIDPMTDDPAAINDPLAR